MREDLEFEVIDLGAASELTNGLFDDIENEGVDAPQRKAD